MHLEQKLVGLTQCWVTLVASEVLSTLALHRGWAYPWRTDGEGASQSELAQPHMLSLHGPFTWGAIALRDISLGFHFGAAPPLFSRIVKLKIFFTWTTLFDHNEVSILYGLSLSSDTGAYECRMDERDWLYHWVLSSAGLGNHSWGG